MNQVYTDSNGFYYIKKYDDYQVKNSHINIKMWIASFEDRLEAENFCEWHNKKYNKSL